MTWLVLIRQFYYLRKLRQYGRSFPDAVQERMLQAVIEAAAQDDTYAVEDDTALSDIPIRSDETHEGFGAAPDAVTGSSRVLTGGSTGPAAAIPIDEAGSDWLQAYVLSVYRRYGWTFGDPVLRLPCLNEGHGWLRDRLVPTIEGDPAAPNQLRQQINEHAPAIIDSYPRILMAAARSGPITHSPEAIIAGGELLTPTMRQELEQTFDTTVVDIYGASEVLWLGIDDDGNGFEPVPGMTRTELPDGIGQPIATGLVNTRTPVLRYRLPDLVEADGDDTIHRILGRTRHVIHQDHGPIYPADLIEQIYQHPDITEFTIGTASDTDIALQIRTAGGTDPSHAIDDQLDTLGLTASIERQEEPLPTTDSHKKPFFTPDFPG